MTWPAGSVCAKAATAGRRAGNPLGKPAVLSTLVPPKRRWRVACMKCGSEWVTLKGRNMVSCPDCCKQQRCKARKQGRLPTTEIKVCARCSCEFEAVGANAIAAAKYCDDCKVIARKEWTLQWKSSVKSGERVTKPQPKKEDCSCRFCGTKLSKGQAKYCSTQCFHSARNAGIQSWDRTGQLESIWHRGGRWACAPSRKPVQEMRTNMQHFLRRIKNVCQRSMRLPRTCKACRCQCRLRFCSDECRHAYSDQLKARKREAKRRYRKETGRHFRQRAKHYGVEYERFPKSLIYERDNYICQLCKGPVLRAARYRRRDGKIHMKSPTIDHIVPISRGGDHKPHNCQTACFKCNSKKGNRAIGQLRLALR